MVKIEDETYERAKKKAVEKGVTLQAYVNDTLMLNLEKDDFLRLYAPHLYLSTMDEYSLFIKDTKKDRTAEIVVRNSELLCYLDESKDCEHVRFALALPEIAALGIPRRTPKSENAKSE